MSQHRLFLFFMSKHICSLVHCRADVPLQSAHPGALWDSGPTGYLKASTEWKLESKIYIDYIVKDEIMKLCIFFVLFLLADSSTYFPLVIRMLLEST